LALALPACATGADAPTGEREEAAPFLPGDRTALAPDTRPQVVFFPRFGNPADDTHGALGPGVVLSNDGIGPQSAALWMHDTVDPARVAGDVAVLSTHGGDTYAEPLYASARFNSVQTVLIPPDAPDSDIATVASWLAGAEIVFVTDGDRASYVAWAGGPVAAAVRAVYDRGGVIAASGVGAAALGVALLVPVGVSDVPSDVALDDPYAATLALVPGPFALPLAGSWIVDVSLRTANRFGRLAAMTARAQADGLVTGATGAALGIGLDDGAALAIDRRGIATLLPSDAATGGDCWLIRGPAAERIAPGQPLVWSNAQVTRFDAPAEALEVAAGCGTAFTYAVSIDGRNPAPFTPIDPYGAQGASMPCSP
jgi:cyanophycinase-like exopeptidase